MAVRVTQTLAEVAGTVTPSIRITRTIAEVAGSVAQPDLRVYRMGVMALVQVAAGTDLTAASGLQFSQVITGSFPKAVAQGVQFSQTVALISTFAPGQTQTVQFGHTAVTTEPIPKTASNSFQFSDSTSLFSSSQTATNGVQFGQLGNAEEAFVEAVTHGVQFDQTVLNFGPVSVSQTVNFTDAGGGGAIIPGGLIRSATQGVQFSDTEQKVLCLAIATSHSATQGVAFSANVSLPIFLIVPDGVVFSETAVGDYTNVIEQDVAFSHVLSFNSIWPRTVPQTLSFSQAVIYEGNIDTCQYSPTLGSSSDPNAPTPPPASLGVISKATQVTLFYPTVSPTSTVIIRAPEYGDRHRLQFERINRETRGGTLEIFADPAWPKLEILEASFTGLKEAEAQAVLDFFTLTLGLEVGFVDWHGRTWHGVIVSPDAQLIRARRGIVDLSFEFEGEVQ